MQESENTLEQDAFYEAGFCDELSVETQHENTSLKEILQNLTHKEKKMNNLNNLSDAQINGMIDYLQNILLERGGLKQEPPQNSNYSHNSE
ncbi:hypothetical protein VH58_06750 [Helicobacter pylori]